MPMPRGLRRGLLIGLAVLVILAAAVLVVANRALDPGTLRPVAESQLSQVLGSPVSVGTLEVRLLPTVRVTGGDITIGAGGSEAAPSLRLAAVKIVPRLSSLLAGNLAISLIELEGLDFRVRRDGQGQWHLPFGEATSGASGAAPDRGKPEPAPPGGADGRDAGAGAGETPARPSVRIDHIGLTGGSFVLVDDALRTASGSPEVAAITDIAATVRVADGTTSLAALSGKLGSSMLSGEGAAGPKGLQLKLRWEDLSAADLSQVLALVGSAPIPGLAIDGRNPLDLDLSVTPDGAVSGTGIVRADRLSFAGTTVTGVTVPVAFDASAANATMNAKAVAIGTLVVSDVEATLSFAGRELRAEPVTLSAYQGRMTGEFGLRVTRPVTWDLSSTLTGLDMNAFLSANTSAKDRLDGTGSLDVRVSGSTAGAVDQTLAGTVKAAITDGVIRNFGLLAAVNAALGLTEGSGKDTNFESLSASLAIGGGRATTRDLLLQMGELRVAAEGTLGFDQTLDFKGRVTLSPAKTAELTARGRDLKLMANANGELELPLTVGGTVADPSFGIDVGQLLKTGATNALKKELEKGLKGLLKKKK